jgi:hypothetical protein
LLVHILARGSDILEVVFDRPSHAEFRQVQVAVDAAELVIGSPCVDQEQNQITESDLEPARAAPIADSARLTSARRDLSVARRSSVSAWLC